MINTLSSKLKWVRDNYDNEATEGDEHSMGALHDEDYYDENPELGLVPIRM